MATNQRPKNSQSDNETQRNLMEEAHDPGKVVRDHRDHETRLESIQIMPYGVGVTPRNITEGDDEFAGHGPEVYMFASIFVRNTNELWAAALMTAEETEPDWTTVSEADYEQIWDGASIGVTDIVSIDSDRQTSASYTDTDHDWDSIWMGFDELVREFRSIGDTDSDDVGRTRMFAFFNPVSLTVRKLDGQHSKTVELDMYPYTPEQDPVRFSPEHVGEGDYEFGGHGPDVDVWAWLTIQNTNELWATVSMSAEETTSDWTAASEVQGYKVWDGDYHNVKEIVSIDSDTFTYDSYTDTDHAEDVLSQRAGELVNRFEATGDTDGDDIGHGTDVEVYFNPVELTVLY